MATMKVAVTSQGKELISDVDPRFGRAAFFILVDMDREDVVVHDNARNQAAPQGAGTRAAQDITDLGADALVTGNIGPKAYVALQANGIKVYVAATGTVAETVEKVARHELELRTADSSPEASDIEDSQ